MSNNAPARSGLAAEIIARNAREGNNQMISEEATELYAERILRDPVIEAKAALDYCNDEISSAASSSKTGSSASSIDCGPSSRSKAMRERAMTDSMTAEEYLAYLAGETTKAPKYGNQAKSVDGFVFDSIAEANHYKDLRLMEAAGAITHLRLQPRYPLLVNGEKIASYVADFEYVDVASGQLVVEDVKSEATKTPVYRLKAKLMRACHGIRVKEIE